MPTSGCEGHKPWRGGRFISWCDDGSIRMWDVNSGRTLAVLDGHTARVRGVVSVEAGRLLSWCNDNTLRLWDAQTGDCLSWCWKGTKTLFGARRPLMTAARCRGPRTTPCACGTGRLAAASWFSEGHTDLVRGALCLHGDRLLSWADDKSP